MRGAGIEHGGRGRCVAASRRCSPESSWSCRAPRSRREHIAADKIAARAGASTATQPPQPPQTPIIHSRRWRNRPSNCPAGRRCPKARRRPSACCGTARTELLPLADKALLFGRKVPDDPKRGTKRLDHDSVSREHDRMIVHSFDGKTLLCDLGSRWGTTLDGAEGGAAQVRRAGGGRHHQIRRVDARLRLHAPRGAAQAREREPASSSAAAGPSSAAAMPPPPPPSERRRRAADEVDDELADPMANYVDEELDAEFLEGDEEGCGVEEGRFAREGERRAEGGESAELKAEKKPRRRPRRRRPRRRSKRRPRRRRRRRTRSSAGVPTTRRARARRRTAAAARSALAPTASSSRLSRATASRQSRTNI